MSIKRTYPDNSLFTNASAHIDGYNGLIIDTTNSAQIAIGTTNASNIVMGNGTPVRVNGFFAPTVADSVLGESGAPWGVFWCNGPISTDSAHALTIQSAAPNAANAENVNIVSFNARDTNSYILRLKNGASGTLAFDGYGNMTYDVFSFPQDRIIKISEPATLSDGYALHLRGGIGGSTTGTKGGNIYLDAGAGNGNIDGYVKIGTNNSYEIDIGKSSASIYMTGTIFQFTDPASGGLTFTVDSATGLQNQTSGNQGWANFGTEGTASIMRWYNSTNTNVGEISKDGYVRIGAAGVPSHALEVIENSVYFSKFPAIYSFNSIAAKFTDTDLICDGSFIGVIPFGTEATQAGWTYTADGYYPPTQFYLSSNSTGVGDLQIRMAATTGFQVSTTGSAGWTNLGTTLNTIPIVGFYSSSNAEVGRIDGYGNLTLSGYIGGGSSSSSTVNIDTTGDINIGSSTSDLAGSTIRINTHVIMSGRASLEVDQSAILNGHVTLGSSSAFNIYIGGTFNGNAGFAQTAGSTSIFKNDITIAGQPSGDFALVGGKGSNADSTYDGYHGSHTYITAGNGGDGYTGKIAGAGGEARLIAGDAGAINGGTGNNGGDIHIRAGQKSGTGLDGYVYIGVSNSSAIHLAQAGRFTYVDGYLGIDSQATLSANGTDTIKLTQPGNTTTGGSLRLRSLKFFDDASPTSQLAHRIYAPDGNSIGVSCNRFHFVAPAIDSSQQDILWNTGAYTVTFESAGTSTFQVMTNNSQSPNAAVIDGYAILSGADASTRHGMRIAIEANTSAGSNGVTLNAIRAIGNDDTSIDGYLIGTNIDVSGGSNTSKLRYTTKEIAHSGYAGSEYIRTTAAVQTTDNSTTTAYTLPLNDNTTYYIKAWCVARRSTGADHAVLGRIACVGRESGGAATKTSTTSTLFGDIHSDPQYDMQINVSGNNITVDVVGDTGHTVNWAITIEIQAIS